MLQLALLLNLNPLPARLGCCTALISTLRSELEVSSQPGYITGPDYTAIAVASCKEALEELDAHKLIEVRCACARDGCKRRRRRPASRLHSAAALRRLLQLEAALKGAHEVDTKDLRARAKTHVETATQLGEECAKLASALESQTTLNSRIAALGEENKEKAVQHQRERASLECSLSNATAGHSKQVDEFQTLLAIKALLGAELGHYRCARVPPHRWCAGSL